MSVKQEVLIAVKNALLFKKKNTSDVFELVTTAVYRAELKTTTLEWCFITKDISALEFFLCYV